MGCVQTYVYSVVLSCQTWQMSVGFLEIGSPQSRLLRRQNVDILSRPAAYSDTLHRTGSTAVMLVNEQISILNCQTYSVSTDGFYAAVLFLEMSSILM